LYSVCFLLLAESNVFDVIYFMIITKREVWL
jgi:hypothetical protein